MADEQLFRTAISGYNKEDVTAYIEGINRAAAENQDWFDRQSKAMADTIKRLTKENAALKKGVDNTDVLQLQAQLEEKTRECAELEEKLAQAPLMHNDQVRTRVEEIIQERKQMQQQIAQYKAQVEQLMDTDAAKELAAATEKIAELEAKLATPATPSAEMLELKHQYESVCAQLVQTQQQAARQIDELTLQNRQLQTQQSNAMFGSSYATDLRLREAQDRVSVMEQELIRLRNENDRLRSSANMSSEELSSIYDKSRLYDDIKDSVSRIIGDANIKAADIVSKAQEEREQILRNGMKGLTSMQQRIKAMKREIDTAQRLYADTSISMTGMFTAINEAVSITDNQLIAILGNAPTEPEEEPAPRKKNDEWRTHLL